MNESINKTEPMNETTTATESESEAIKSESENSAAAADLAKTTESENSATPANPAKRTKRRLSGVVVCDKADKTVRIHTDRRVRHPLYEKIIRRRGSVAAHDAGNVCRVGDKVIVEETPRYSKTKSWRVVERQGEAI